jgi:hypothetical protein
VTFDFNSKESIPKGLVQIGSTYYNHIDIPVLIVIALLWYNDQIIKRIFTVTSSSNKQDTSYVIDSINYILGLFFIEYIFF